MSDPLERQLQRLALSQSANEQMIHEDEIRRIVHALRAENARMKAALAPIINGAELLDMDSHNHEHYSQFCSKCRTLEKLLDLIRALAANA